MPWIGRCKARNSDGVRCEKLAMPKHTDHRNVINGPNSVYRNYFWQEVEGPPTPTKPLGNPAIAQLYASPTTPKKVFTCSKVCCVEESS